MADMISRWVGLFARNAAAAIMAIALWLALPLHARPVSTAALPGREEDARVARIAFRLATTGTSRCGVVEPEFGLVLQHLTQFQLADRSGMIADQSLDRGPGVAAIVPGGPADAAGIHPGDVLLTIDGTALPPEPDLSIPFDAKRAHARADAIRDVLAHAGTTTVALTILRQGAVLPMKVTPVPACPSAVHLARSSQRNAFADGRHVFLTTAVVSRLGNDDELAFLIAHEMAHNILGHASVMRSGEVRHGLAKTFGRSGRIVRGTEHDADALGGELMIDAGFDPVRGAAVLRRIGGTDLGIDLFASHESTSARIAAMRALVAAREDR